jgi:hexokinase
MEVTALINDTVGTLMARRYQSPTENCLVGLILGTGSNAAYVEKIDNIGKWEGPKDTELMVVNTEWGGFDKGKRCLPYTGTDSKNVFYFAMELYTHLTIYNYYCRIRYPAR